MAYQTIYLAAGCFWGVQYYFDEVPGVVETEVGYMGGRIANPTYEQVCYENTGHAETVRVVYDDAKTSTDTILKQFFRMHDPTQVDRQGIDVGNEYRSAIFYTTDAQRQAAESIKQAVATNFDEPVVTSIEPAPEFYPAEAYHQKFTARTGRGMCHIPYTPVD